MSQPRRLSLRTAGSHERLRLDEVLAAWLPGALGRKLSRSNIRRLIMAGAVTVEGRALRRPGWPVPAGADIEARVRLELFTPATADSSVALSEPDILYEDEFLLAVNKPAGLPMHPTADPDRPHLVGAIVRFLAGRRGPTPYLGVHQRLDRDTSGVVLFTRDRTANAGLAALIAAHGIVKTYHALTARPKRLPPRSWSNESRLARTGKGRMGSVPFGGSWSRTDFKRIEVLPRGLLVEARPLTGRQHQIRVHLAEAGLPILGDRIYAGRQRHGSAARALLHLVSLAFRHPLTGKAVLIESPYPDDFRQALAVLRRELSQGDGPTRRPRR